MEQIYEAMSTLENSAVKGWMFKYFDYTAYTVGFYMVFLFWCPNLVKHFLIKFNVSNPSVTATSADAMPPHGSPKIALAQLAFNLFFCMTSCVAFRGIGAPLYETIKEVGLHDAVCVYQENLLDRGPVIFWICAVCLFLYIDILYSGLMAAQNIHKQLEVAKSRGLPVPAKVMSGIRFFEYVYRATTLVCPWMMLTVDFISMTFTILNGLVVTLVLSVLLAIENVMVIRAPALAAKHELKFMVVRDAVRFCEGVVGFVLMAYTYTASDCYAMPYVNRAALLYYFLIMFFTSLDLLEVVKTGKNPMHVVYENDLPENRAQMLKQN